jgi:hypothetical protein
MGLFMATAGIALFTPLLCKNKIKATKAKMKEMVLAHNDKSYQ